LYNWYDILFFHNAVFVCISQGDFGEARSFTMDHTGTMTALGSMLYMAPEIVRNQKCAVVFSVSFSFI
jgi:serine/threonine protein kinase